MQAGKLIDSQFRMAAANQQYITGVLKAFTFFPKLARECFRQTHKRVSAVFIRHKTCTVQSYLKRSSYAKGTRVKQEHATSSQVRRGNPALASNRYS